VRGGEEPCRSFLVAWGDARGACDAVFDDGSVAQQLAQLM
jgi:hypothetical protein